MRPLLVRYGWLWLLSCTGCAMCASPYDCQYVAYGGVRERTDMVHGRVASVYAPAADINHAVYVPAEEYVPPGKDAGQSTADADDGSDQAKPPEKSDTPPTGGPRPPATPSNLPEVPQGTLELPELENGAPNNLPNGSSDPLDALPDREAALGDHDWTKHAF